MYMAVRYYNSRALLIAAGLLLGLRFVTPAYGQDEFGTFASSMTPSPQRLIDLPTAGTLAKGTAAMSLRVYSGGGLLGSITAGVSDRLMMGVSYGGDNLLGTGKINWNARPEVAIKYLILTETRILPALALGFESQGFGPYDDNLNRYQVKARGFYGVFTRNLPVMGNLGLHAGVNYGIENKDKDGKLNLFLGVDKTVNDYISLMAEYDLAQNDDQSLPGLGRNKGYLNIGARLTLGGRFGIEFDLRNMLDNRKGSVSPSRELKVLYSDGFDI